MKDEPEDGGPTGQGRKTTIRQQTNNVKTRLLRKAWENKCNLAYKNVGSLHRLWRSWSSVWYAMTRTHCHVIPTRGLVGARATALTGQENCRCQDLPTFLSPHISLIFCFHFHYISLSFPCIKLPLPRFDRTAVLRTVCSFLRNVR